MVRPIQVFLITAGLVACGCSSRPAFKAPAPYEDSGVRVELDGYYRQGFDIVGLIGTATNVSGQELSPVLLTFDVVDKEGVKVNEAIASTNSLAVGQKWRFNAVFTSPFSTKINEVRPGKVQTFSGP